MISFRHVCCSNKLRLLGHRVHRFFLLTKKRKKNDNIFIYETHRILMITFVFVPYVLFVVTAMGSYEQVLLFQKAAVLPSYCYLDEMELFN